MDQFRKNKSPQKRPLAVDGFLGTKPTPQGAVRQNRASQLQQNRLDNFRGAAGFHANAQPLLKTSARPNMALPQQRAINNPGKIELPNSPAARGKARGKRHPFRSAIKGFAVFLILVLGTGGFLFGKGYLNAKNIFKGGGDAPALSANVDPTRLKGEGDGRVNVLLLGHGGAGHDGAELTDTLLVASIDPIQKNASLLSIPRDLWVRNGSGYSKINQVYVDAKNRKLATLGSKAADRTKLGEEAGQEAIEATIEQAMGIPVHYYVMVDFKAFEQAINTVGGIDINVTAEGVVYERLWDHARGKTYVLDVKQGKNHFDGQRALFYSRSRQTSARGDFSRSERQRAVIIALKEKILSAGTYGNPTKINELINTFGGHVRSNLGTNDLKRMYDIAKTIDSSKITSLGLADPPNSYVTTGRSPSGLSIVHPRAGLTDYSEIQSYVRNALRDSFLQKENASIAVYNGTKQNGLATTKANELKSFGYGITTVANAPSQTQTKTMIVDLTQGQKKYTKHYLQQRLGGTVTATIPDATINPGNADFVIILGNDAIKR